MRRGVAVLCVVLVLPVMRAKAESAVSAADAPSMRVERPWLQTGLDRGPDERLGQAETDLPAKDVDARVSELQAQRAGISRKWPTAGVIAGGVMTTAGVATLALNVFCGAEWLGDDDEHNDHSDCTSGWVAGGIVTGAGVALLGASGAVLASRNRERRAIDREIDELKRSAAARRSSSFGFAIDLGERKGFRLAWRY